MKEFEHSYKVETIIKTDGDECRIGSQVCYSLLSGKDRVNFCRCFGVELLMKKNIPVRCNPCLSMFKDYEV